MDAYDTLAGAQIAVQKAANVEGFCVEELRSRVDRLKQKKLCGLVAAVEKRIGRKVTVFTTQALMCLFLAHGASSYARAGKNAAGNRSECAEHNHEYTDNIAVFRVYESCLKH